jgi:hypothetical protein
MSNSFAHVWWVSQAERLTVRARFGYVAADLNNICHFNRCRHFSFSLPGPQIGRSSLLNAARNQVQASTVRSATRAWRVIEVNYLVSAIAFDSPTVGL